MLPEITVLQNSVLFRGNKPADIEAMLNCLQYKVKTYPKETFIFHAGEKLTKIGIVLKGEAHVIKEDYWGNRTIYARIGAGDNFGEVYAAPGMGPVEVSVLAPCATTIMFLDMQRVMQTCSNSCTFHQNLIHNLVALLSEKNVFLTKKLGYLAKRSTREKLLAYLSDEAMKKGAPDFTIPFNRQQLADYLAVDRSAMSSELSKLQKAKIINFEKNTFHLLSVE